MSSARKLSISPPILQQSLLLKGAHLYFRAHYGPKCTMIGTARAHRPRQGMSWAFLSPWSGGHDQEAWLRLATHILSAFLAHFSSLFLVGVIRSFENFLRCGSKAWERQREEFRKERERKTEWEKGERKKERERLRTPSKPSKILLFRQERRVERDREVKKSRTSCLVCLCHIFRTQKH